MKISYVFIFCFLICGLSAANANAQSAISLSTGISTDINNSNSFYQIPFSLIWKPFRNIKSPVFLEFDYDLPLGSKSTGEAYTLNPALPQKITLKEKIRPYVFTASFGFRIHLFSACKKTLYFNADSSCSIKLVMNICA